MKAVLIALNAKYAHTNPAVRVLRLASGVPFKEYTINMRPEDILADLYDEQISLYGFSAYIWNISLVLRLARLVKTLNPSAAILLGGPEASFDCEELLHEHPWVDYILAGEGETAFPALLEHLSGRLPVGQVPSLFYRDKDAVRSNPPSPPCDRGKLPFPYEDLSALSRRVIYYESSRGCPYRCAFCLSPAAGPVRHRDISLVKRDIDAFFAAGAMKVKFVDRTFNADIVRAKEIWAYVIQKEGDTGFHFEISAELLDEESVALLSSAPPGRIQVEAGLQTLYAPTLKAIRRPQNFETVRRNLIPLIRAGRVHTHVDLIAGLPYEGYADFGTSFDGAFSLRAHMLQLGFLKLIRGSELRERAAELGIVYMPEAPYTVLATPPPLV